MKRESAEDFAVSALAWLAEADLIDAFLDTAGVDRADLRAAAGQPDFLAAVLEFVAQRDDWVVACCAAVDMPPERLSEARMALPGGDLPHWT